MSFTPTGHRFFDKASNREMMLVTEGYAKNWLVYKHPDGNWVTLRRLTEEDALILISALAKQALQTT